MARVGSFCTSCGFSLRAIYMYNFKVLFYTWIQSQVLQSWVIMHILFFIKSCLHVRFQSHILWQELGHHAPPMVFHKELITFIILKSYFILELRIRYSRAGSSCTYYFLSRAVYMYDFKVLFYGKSWVITHLLWFFIKSYLHVQFQSPILYLNLESSFPELGFQAHPTVFN